MKSFFSVYSYVKENPVLTNEWTQTELEILNSLWGLGTEWESGYRTGPPARYRTRLPEFIPWNRFLGSINI